MSFSRNSARTVITRTMKLTSDVFAHEHSLTHTHTHTHTHTAPLFDSLSFTARAPAEDTLTARTDVAARQLRARQPVRAASPETQDALGLLRLRTLVGFYAPNHKGDFKCAPLQCGARTHSPAAANTQRTR